MKHSLGLCETRDEKYQLGPFTYIDSNGTSHLYKNTLYWDTNNDCPEQSSFTEIAADGSGLKLQVETSDWKTVTATVIASDGTVFTPPQNGAVGGTVVDANGNNITTSSNYPVTITDTLGGSPVLTVNRAAPFQNCESSPVAYTYTAPGGQATVTVNYGTYSVQTNFGVLGIQDWTTPVAECLVKQITLPDNTNYQFTYELTNGAGTNVTGRIASVRLPTGGVINYSYSGTGCSNCMMADGSPSFMQRAYVQDGGTWAYTRQLNPNGNGNPQFIQTTVVDPANNETDFNFNGLYETRRSTYQGRANGGTLLDTQWPGYNSCWGGCDTTTLSLPITSKHYNDTPAGFGANHLWYDYTYDPQYGLLQVETDRDFGNVGTILRTITTTYNTALCSSKGICDHPASVQVLDGGSNQKSLTNYSYDGNGNTTEVDRWVSGRYYLNTSLVTIQWHGQNRRRPEYLVDTLLYIWLFLQRCVSKQRWGIQPISNQWLYTKYTYNCNGGVITSVTDPNGHVAYTGYGNDKYFWSTGLVK